MYVCERYASEGEYDALKSTKSHSRNDKWWYLDVTRKNYHKFIKSEKYFPNTGGETKCESCKMIYINTDLNDNLKTEEHIILQKEQQSKY